MSGPIEGVVLDRMDWGEYLCLIEFSKAASIEKLCQTVPPGRAEGRRFDAIS